MIPGYPTLIGCIPNYAYIKAQKGFILYVTILFYIVILILCTAPCVPGLVVPPPVPLVPTGRFKPHSHGWNFLTLYKSNCQPDEMAKSVRV